MARKPSQKKKLDVKILLSALIISAILFLSGIFIGYSINEQNLGSIENNIQSVTRTLENFQLQFLFFDVLGENATCPLLTETLSEINKESYDIGSKLTITGSESEIKDYNEYITLKKEYSRLLVSYWLLSNKFNNVCEQNVDTVIYFFSKDCVTCDDQGFVLTYLKGKFDEKLLIFALDADLDEPSLLVLKNYFNVTEFPTMIINNDKYEGFHSKDEIINILTKGES